MQIKNFAKFEFLKTFELTKHTGEHSRLNFSASIAESAAESCLGCTGKIISVVTDDNIPIFFGRVEAVEVESSFVSSEIYVSCVSLSILTDEKIKTRIFHNPDKKLSEVLNVSRLSLENSTLKLSDELAAKKYSSVILQNQETNFQFVSRLAKTFGQRFWIIDTLQPTSFVVDSCVHRSARKIDRSQIISARRVKVSGQSKFFLKTKLILTVGQAVTVEGLATEYVIIGVEIRLEHETFIFRYELEELNLPAQKLSDAPILAKTLKLHAKIKNVNDPKNLGRVQVSFDDKFLEDMDEKNPLWISYRTPYSGKNGGIVFIPDVGDAVEVFFTNEEIFCVSAIRENPLAEECKKVAEKYIGNNTRQRIFWKEKSLELFSGENKIVMNEQGIELTVGKNSVTINKQGILLRTANGKFSLAKDAAIHVDGKFESKAKDTELNADGKLKVGSREISVEGGGETNIKAGGTLKLAGSKVELC